MINNFFKKVNRKESWAVNMFGEYSLILITLLGVAAAFQPLL